MQALVRVEDNPSLTGLSGDPLEPYVANAEGDPCVSDGFKAGETALLDEYKGTPYGFPFPAPFHLYAAGVYSRTRSTDGSLAPAGEAEAGAASVSFTDHFGYTWFRAELLKTNARAFCEGGEPALESDSTVAEVEPPVGYRGVTDDAIKPVDGEEMKIPLDGLGTLWINYEDRTTEGDGGQITRRAVFFDADPALEGATGDVIVAESIADYHGNPC